MSTDTIPVAPLSIWDPVHLGTDELGRRVEVTLAERNMLIGGCPREPAGDIKAESRAHGNNAGP
jgi:hypothetical protein